LVHEYIEIFEYNPRYITKIKESELNQNDKKILKGLDDSKKITISYTGNIDNFLQISTNSFICSVYLEGPEKTINVIPKIFKDITQTWDNLNFFLDFCDDNKLDLFKNAKNFYEASTAHTLLNRIHNQLLEEYGELEKQGLLKSYVIHAENTSSMRGKLLMQHQMINDAMLRPQFFCEFDELEYDSVENRIILQALTIVQRTSKSNDIRMRSMDFAQRLSGQVTKTIVTKPERQRIMQSYNRQNLRYRRIHSICEKVIVESGIGDIYRGDTSYVAPVFYDMNEYFERFVQKLFQKCYKKTGFEVKVQLSKPAWTGEGNLGPRRMKPDITIWDGKICKYILDVKYKTKNISSGDLYQLGFYMHEFSEMNPTSGTSTEIKKAYAITPEYKDMAYGTYESQTKRQVVVKRINLTKCLDIIKHNNFEKIGEEIKKAKGDPKILFNYLC